MSEPFIGEIRIFPFPFAPSGWAACNGQLLPVQQNAALFSILGTAFGGNGTTNFALPNLQGAVPVGVGQGVALSNYPLGQSGGSATVTLPATQFPTHSHPLTADAEVSTALSPAGAILMDGHFTASTGSTTGKMAAYSTDPPDTALNAGAVVAAGGGGAHNNMMPYLALNICIALTGIFPPRS